MSEPLKLAVGDRVVYPNQGLCTVTGIDVKEIAGQRLAFVTLQREEDGSKIMTPEAKVASVGVRKVAGADDAQKVFAYLKSDSDMPSLDWKMRARVNQERMATGGLIGLGQVVKELMMLSELRALPPKERELYASARHQLCAEIAVALKIPECDAEDAIDVILCPPGKERPKRTAAEFASGGGEDELGLEGDLLGIDGEEPEEAEEAEEKPEGEEAEGDGEEGGDDEDAPKKKPAKKPAAEKPAKAAKPPKAEKIDMGEKTAARRSVVSDMEVTAPHGSPLLVTDAPKKRGRPPKAKVEAPPAEPKKRGRPPKAAAAKTEEPKKAAKPPAKGKK